MLQTTDNTFVVFAYIHICNDYNSYIWVPWLRKDVVTGAFRRNKRIVHRLEIYFLWGYDTFLSITQLAPPEAISLSGRKLSRVHKTSCMLYWLRLQLWRKPDQLCTSTSWDYSAVQSRTEPVHLVPAGHQEFKETVSSVRALRGQAKNTSFQLINNFQQITFL